MDTHKKIREHISALSDGELSADEAGEAREVLDALQAAEGEHVWNTYHRIGDELRAQATPDLSEGFSARLAARLAAESTPRRRSGRTSPQAPPVQRIMADLGSVALAAAAAVVVDAQSGELADAQVVASPKPAIVTVS